MTPLVLISLYSITIVASALLGGQLPTLLRLTHLRMQMILSMVGGLMLGIALLHMLPHSMAISSAAVANTLDFTMAFVLLGLLATFLMMRAFHFHQHTGEPDQSRGNSHEHDCGHNHGGHRLSWAGVALGLSMHTFIDGIALGAAVMADADLSVPGHVYGLGVYLAILLHKPLDALSISSLMRASGWSWRAIQATNAGFAMMCPLGAICFAMGIDQSSIFTPIVLGGALAMSAGVFLCISLSDLLPELQFHRHHPLQLTAALLFGIVLAYGIKLVEPTHVHAPTSIELQHGHDHSH